MRFSSKTSATAADFAISTVKSQFSDLLAYAIELAKSIPPLAKRACVEAWRFLVEEKDKVKLVVAVFVAGVIGFGLLKLCYRCCCGRRGGRMMKAPGGGGARIPRAGFEGNPRGYFRALRSRPMQKSLERYQRCSYGSLESTNPSKEAESYQEYLRLKAKVDVLQRSQRNILGEDLNELGTKDLEHLENQLDKSLRQIRSTMTQILLDQLADLQRKEENLLESNRSLKHELEESLASLQMPTQDAEVAADNAPRGRNDLQLQPAQQEAFFEALNCDSTLQLGYNHMGIAPEQVNASTSAQNGNGYVPDWML